MLLNDAIRLFKKYMLNIDRAKETVKAYTLELRRLDSFMAQKYNGPVYVSDITIDDLDNYMQMLKAKGNSPSSRNRSVYILRSFFNFCFRKGILQSNPGLKIETVPAPEKERVFITRDELDVLLKQIHTPLGRVILNTLFYTGMRISECVNLSVKDVSLSQGIINVRNTKNKKERQIPIHAELMPLLRVYYSQIRRKSSCPYFFVSRNNTRVSPDYINRLLNEAVYKLNWNKKITAHIIRHSFASSLVARNVNIVAIQKLLGHSSLSTTSVYTHTNMSELIKAVNTI